MKNVINQHKYGPISIIFLSILCCNQSDDDPQEDLAKFGYKLNIKIKN
jgi:hypothetical protein